LVSRTGRFRGGEAEAEALNSGGEEKKKGGGHYEQFAEVRENNRNRENEQYRKMVLRCAGDWRRIHGLRSLMPFLLSQPH